MIQVQIDKLKSDLDTLKKAIGDFEPYSANFIRQCISDLDGQNSDFVEAAKDALMGMTDTKAPQLLEKVKEFHEGGVVLVKTFEETDANIADSEKINK